MEAVKLIPLTRDYDFAAICFRAEDEAECRALGNTASTAAKDCLRDNEESYAVYCGGALVGFAGYRYTDTFGPVDVWLLTTEEVERHKVSFVKFARHYLTYLMQYNQVRVFVSVKYRRALRLCEFLGFTFGEPLGGFVMGVTR